MTSEEQIINLIRENGKPLTDKTIKAKLEISDENFESAISQLLNRGILVRRPGQGAPYGLSDKLIEIDNETEEQLDLRFIGSLRDLGGRASNVLLRQRLGFAGIEIDKDRYLASRGRLVASGAVILGQGRGGTVELVGNTDEASDFGSEADTSEEFIEEKVKIRNNRPRLTEKSLYPSLLNQIETEWAKAQNYEQGIAEATHTQGSRITGGTYTRPDITFVAKKNMGILARLRVGSCNIRG